MDLCVRIPLHAHRIATLLLLVNSPNHSWFPTVEYRRPVRIGRVLRIDLINGYLPCAGHCQCRRSSSLLISAADSSFFSQGCWPDIVRILCPWELSSFEHRVTCYKVTKRKVEGRSSHHNCRLFLRARFFLVTPPRISIKRRLNMLNAFS